MRTISVLDIFDKTAFRLPDKIYLRDEEESVTYGQCREYAMKLGYALYQKLEGETRKPIVLFLDKSCRCVISMLGVLYSGNFYVPMDIKTPLERLKSILKTLRNATLIASEKEILLLQKIGYQGEVLIYEDLLYEQKMENDSLAVLKKIRAEIIDTDLIYILFTSGSTGAPKGVAVMQRSVIDYIEAFTEAVNVEEEDIHGSQTPFYTDMSLKDIYMAMRAGATICLIPQKLFMSPKKLLQYLDDNCVTTLMWVPTAYRLISQFDALEKIRPNCLKKFLFSGEALPLQVYSYWKKYYPQAEFVQQYGPTEITGACTSYRIQKDHYEGTIPIGKPLSNTGILLLNEENRKINVTDLFSVGEICVFGSCLTAGYYNAPEKTKSVFVQNPTVTDYPFLIYRTGDLGRYDKDGNLVFVSRKDHQIKHGGRRIELGEIEAAFQLVDGIKAACCVQNRKEDRLILYYIGDIEEKEMSFLVDSRLPKYMIPTIYHKLAELPQLPNGKLDRKQIDAWANG